MGSRSPRGGPTNALACLAATCSRHPCANFAQKKQVKQSQTPRRQSRRSQTCANGVDCPHGTDDRQEPTSPRNLYPAYPFVFYEHDGRQWPSPSGIPAPDRCPGRRHSWLLRGFSASTPNPGNDNEHLQLLHTQLDAANASPSRIDRTAATLTTADRR